MPPDRPTDLMHPDHPTVTTADVSDNQAIRDLFNAVIAAADQDLTTERICEIVKSAHAYASDSDAHQ